MAEDLGEGCLSHTATHKETGADGGGADADTEIGDHYGTEMDGVHAELFHDREENGGKNQYGRGHVHKGTDKKQQEIDRQEDDKGKDNFITELSMDETDQPQRPVDLFFILAAIANESIPAQTIAPKFTGRFNKGINYAGDLKTFTREFEQDLAVIAYAIEQFNLPENLKLSVHSGSDKFSIYKPIRTAIRKFNSGLHLKTAGTTWLEELIGLAIAGEDGLKIAKDIYKNAISRFDELCEPYATVIDIDKTKLPTTKTADSWSGEEFAAALRHDPTCEQYNPHFRQLLHLAYKLAAEMKSQFLDALDQHRGVIAENVTHNLYQKHIKPLFLDTPS